MQIEKIEVTQINPYKNNSRKNEEAIKYVAQSISQFGFKQPIVLDNEQNKIIVCGHTRWMAAKELNLKTVPCIYADDLTEEQIKAYRLADNKVAEFAGWDFEQLELELADIENIDMASLGFDNEEFDINQFFEENQSNNKENKAETITCPHCGMKFEV